MNPPEGSAECLLNRVVEVIPGREPVAIAVSGGLDSMTLAHVVRRSAGCEVHAFHAVSPAVPPEATRRVRDHATRWGWVLRIIDAGEFGNASYLANPVNRCFFCKTHLYGAIRSRWPGLLLSGTNMDDLQDYRPGLQAAADRGVVHPYVLAGLDKAQVRRLARHLELPDIQDLPAQPCLASRIETGIAIDPGDLQMVDRIEALVRLQLGQVPVRCRVRRRGIILEIEERVLRKTGSILLTELSQAVTQICTQWGRIFNGVEPYRMGNATVASTDEITHVPVRTR